MQYRHSFHAGNFADVHKHVALLALLAAMQKKVKGLLYLDTHAGGGLYDLRSDDAVRGAEALRGIERLTDAAPTQPELRAYVAALGALRSALKDGRHRYPGSPVLAQFALRSQDRGVCIETISQEARHLERALLEARGASPAVMRVEHGDGYERLGALLPPPERRALVLIDPPYEGGDEHERILLSLQMALKRFDSGVFAVWFPIKRQRDTDNWLAKLTRTLRHPTLAAQLWMHPRDSAVALNGSGLVIVNPPWQMDSRLGQWQEELRVLLGGDDSSGSEVRWLVNE